MTGQVTSDKHVFISHAIEDIDFAQRLAGDLKRLGAQVWIAPHSILPGESWLEAIERGLGESSHVVIVLTPAALEASGVKMERDIAITLALQNQIKVISLLLKSCEVPLVLSRYQMILAFQEDYETGLNQLAGHLGLQVAPPKAEVIERPQQPPGRQVSSLPLVALAVLLGLVIGAVVIGVFLSGSISAGEEPVPVVVDTPPLTPSPSASATPTETNSPPSPSPTPVIVVVTATPLPATDTPTPAPPTDTPTPVPPAPTPTPVPATPTPQPPPPTPALGIGSTLVREKDGMEMVYVTGGTFQMGSTDAEVEAAFVQCEQERGSGACQRKWFEGESPRHSVTLDPLWIDRTEVTNAQFERFVQATGYRTNAEEKGTGWAYTAGGWGEVAGADWRHPSGPETSILDRPHHPVVQVSWNDASSYCQWAGGRLPTEAEWEYAARGPDGYIYPWGNNPPNDTLLNYDAYDKNVGGTTQVGSYPGGQSWVGALDMAGNVWEWVSDWYAADYYAVSPAENPTGPDTGERKARRGGSLCDGACDLRSAFRFRNYPDNRYSDFGFRCVVASTSSP